jgi:hypothetical protein
MVAGNEHSPFEFIRFQLSLKFSHWELIINYRLKKCFQIIIEIIAPFWAAYNLIKARRSHGRCPPPTIKTITIGR